jgi:hypothetical protein
MKYFCSSPFVCTRQNAYNRISPCAFGPIEVNVDADLSQTDRWLHPELEKLRGKFLKGEQPSECKRCWDEENAGIPSLRQRTNEMYGNEPPANWKNGPKEVVIKTSNVCNIACRTCAGWDSSYYWPEGKYYTEVYKTTRLDKNGIREPGNDFVQNRNKMYHNSNLWEIKNLSNLEKFSFFGGEPLLDKQHAILLKKVIDADRAKNTTLFYSTNCQQIGSHYEHLWKQFKRVELFFSIDGIGKQFEYLRWPGDWEKTKRNIDWFLELPNKYPDTEWYFQGSQCISLLNIADYQPTTDWLIETLGAVYYNIVDHPRHYRMTNLPEWAKQELIPTIQDYGIHNYLTLEKCNTAELEQMIVWTKRQDLYRKQNYPDVFPNTFEYIKDYWKNVNNLIETESL